MLRKTVSYILEDSSLKRGPGMVRRLRISAETLLSTAMIFTAWEGVSAQNGLEKLYALSRCSR